MDYSKKTQPTIAAGVKMAIVIFILLTSVMFGSPLFALSISKNTQQIEFMSGQVSLSGTLILPDTPGPHPAIVVVHGSGASDRSNWSEHTDHFPSVGVAVLRFDKRGVGESTGDWMLASLQDLADDVLAAVSFLQQHPAINARQVGVWGGSQGWSVGALAAARSQGDVAFAIIVSGAPEGQWEQEKFRVRAVLRQENVTHETVERVEKLQAEMAGFLRTGDGSTLRELAGMEDYAKVLHYVIKGGVLPPDNHPAITWWRLNFDFVPLDVIPQIRCPVLSVWGDKDFLVDSRRAASLSRSAFDRSNHGDYTEKIFTNADHGLYHRKEQGAGWASRDDRTLVPGFIELTTDWLLQRVTVGESN